MSKASALTRDEYKERAAIWRDAHVSPIAARIHQYATMTGRGQPPGARVYLRDVAEASPDIAQAALGAMLAGIVRQDGLTAMAANVARRVAKVCGKPLADNEEGLKVGYVLIGILCDVTGAARIADKHGDRPEKVAGGVRLSPVYELQVVKGGFLSEAAAYGKVGMPTYSKAPPVPWTAQDAGGVEGQEGGMVHSAGKVMAGVTPDTAPALFDAANHAQAAPFKVNPATSSVLMTYDAAKAFGWLVDHYKAKGMADDAARAAAKEAARL